MKEFNFKESMNKAAFHASILLRGLARTLFGALNAFLLGIAAYGFIQIRKEDGYTAVFSFVGACALVMIALANAYLLGCKKRGKKR
jgi:hypothetical protein